MAYVKMTVTMMDIRTGCVHSTALCRFPVCVFSCPSPDAPPSTPPSTTTPSTLKRPLLLSKRTGLGLGSPLGPVKNYSHAKQLPIAHRPSIFQSPDDDDDDEEDYEQWLEIKGKLWDGQGLAQGAVVGSAAHRCPSEAVRFEQSEPPW